METPYGTLTGRLLWNSATSGTSVFVQAERHSMRLRVVLRFALGEPSFCIHG